MHLIDSTDLATYLETSSRHIRNQDIWQRKTQKHYYYSRTHAIIIWFGFPYESVIFASHGVLIYTILPLTRTFTFADKCRAVMIFIDEE